MSHVKRKRSLWRAMLPLLAMVCIAQSEAPPEAPKTDDPMQLSDLPAEVRLGVRVEGVRRRLPVARTLVIVPSVDAYLDALNRWTMDARYPILINDGTDEARERIAQFSRAFQPQQVLMWDGDGVFDLKKSESFADRQASIENIVARAWGAEDRNTLVQTWLDIGFAPPGVVVTSLLDRAWPAAAALAAGRGQLIMWFEESPRGRLGSVMAAEQLAAFDSAVQTALDELNIAWRDKGDIIDAVTLCLNMPTKIPSDRADENGPLALTDRIGRHADASRWAWCGQVFGDESESVWRAMCALFLQPSRVWFFDGYRAKSGFEGYEVEPAAELFTQRGYEVTTDHLRATGLDAWRMRSRLGVDAGFVHVNTSGVSRRFNLTPGRPYGADVPQLWTPAIVHFIHSFSAQNLDDERSIASRWLARGAYAYVGSVQEPFLQAFQTPEALAQRLFAPSPLAVAASRDLRRPWRVAIFGDPLITLGPPAPEADMPELEGAVAVETSMQDALRARDLEGGLEGLILLGRDADAARLLRAVVEDDPKKLTPRMAQLGWRIALRTGQTPVLLALLDVMDESTQSDPELGDLLWMALRPSLATGNANAINALRTRLRPESYSDDVIELAEAIELAEGPAAARAWTAAMRQQTTSERHRGRIDEGLRR